MHFEACTASSEPPQEAQGLGFHEARHITCRQLARLDACLSFLSLSRQAAVNNNSAKRC